MYNDPFPLFLSRCLLIIKQQYQDTPAGVVVAKYMPLILQALGWFSANNCIALGAILLNISLHN
jgi:hypothetical protein